MTSDKSLGTHVCLRIEEASFTQPSSNNLEAFMQWVKRIVQDAGATIVGETSYAFDGGGFTAVLLLAESHVAVHTWPEERIVTADVFMCHYSQNNSDVAKNIAQNIAELFGGDTKTTVHER